MLSNLSYQKLTQAFEDEDNNQQPTENSVSQIVKFRR